MAEFSEVMKQRERMHNAFENNCDNCPISSFNNGIDLVCERFTIYHPQESEKIIMNWAKEHPAKTNAEKFKEVFGFDISKGAGGCNGTNCPPNKFCSECDHLGFWNKEYKEQSNDTSGNDSK